MNREPNIKQNVALELERFFYDWLRSLCVVHILPLQRLVEAPNADRATVVGADDRTPVRAENARPDRFASCLGEDVRLLTGGQVPQDDGAIDRGWG